MSNLQSLKPLRVTLKFPQIVLLNAAFHVLKRSCSVSLKSDQWSYGLGDYFPPLNFQKWKILALLTYLKTTIPYIVFLAFCNAALHRANNL